MVKVVEEEVLALMAEVTGAIAGNALRARLQPVVAKLLQLIQLDESNAEWLTGPAPRFKAPGNHAYRLRSERMSAAGKLIGGERAVGNMKFLSIQFEEADQGGIATLSMAAEQLGIDHASLRTKYSMAKAQLRLSAVNPWTNRVDFVELVKLDEQPIDKRAALREAQARLDQVLALKAKPNRPGGRRSY